ncbi:hypothetical protein K523DRAFT_220474, partial [Schizophyllum commune Tattone D]
TQSTNEHALLAININRLHQIMGHTNFESLRNIVHHGQLGEVDTLTSIPSFCEPCIMGKMKKLPFKRSTTPASRPLQFVSCDVGGPVEPAAIGGYLY